MDDKYNRLHDELLYLSAITETLYTSVLLLARVPERELYLDTISAVYHLLGRMAYVEDRKVFLVAVQDFTELLKTTVVSLAPTEKQPVLKGTKP